jgi:hypothetical protein
VARRVVPRVTLRATRGGRFLGRVLPAQRAQVDLEQRSGGDWVVVATGTVARGRFTVRVRRAAGKAFRAVVRSLSDGEVIARSARRRGRS